MSTFLQLVQAVERDVKTFPSVLSTVTGATGRDLIAVNKVIEAWNELQVMSTEWRWMRADIGAQVTVADQPNYDPVTDWSLTRFSRWVTLPRNTSIYLQSDGVAYERLLTEIPWETYRRKWVLGTQTSLAPIDYAISPADDFWLGPIPDGVYVVNGEYWKTPQTLSADADLPELPARYHDVIRHLAVMKFSARDSHQNVYGNALAAYNSLMGRLRHEQMPRVQAGEALA